MKPAPGFNCVLVIFYLLNWYKRILKILDIIMFSCVLYYRVSCKCRLYFVHVFVTSEQNRSPGKESAPFFCVSSYYTTKMGGNS